MLSAAGGAGAMAFGMTMVLTDHFTNIADNISRRLILLDSQVDRYNNRISHNMQRSVNTIQSGIAQTFYGAALALPFAVAIEKAGEYQMSLIRIENLLQDTAKAQLFLANIEKDALKFPALGTQDLLAISANILQVNGDVVQVRKSVNDLALAMLQSGQTGGMAFQRMGLNLQQVFSRGILSFSEAKQWATAGLPIYKAFDELGIKYGEGIAVSAKDALRALEKMAGSEKVLDKIRDSAAGAGASLKELAEMTLVKFGLAIEKEFVKFAKALGVLLTDLRTFFESNIGKFAAKMIVLTTAFVSFGLVLLGLFRIWTGLKNLFVSGFAYLFRAEGLSLLLKTLGRFAMALWLIPKLIKSDNQHLQDLALIIGLVTGKLGFLVWVVSFFSRAWKDFTNFMDNGVKSTTKMGEMFIFLGGIMQGLIDFFNTWDGENFSFSYKMDKALRDSGAMKYLLGVIWIIKSLIWFVGLLIEGVEFLAENKWIVILAAGFYTVFRLLEMLIFLLDWFNIKTILSGKTATGIFKGVFSALAGYIVSILSFSWGVFKIFIESLAIGFWEVAKQLFSGITWALAGIRTAFMTTFVPTIVAGLTEIGIAFGLAGAPLWVIALIVLAIILIIAGVIYLIYTYWEDILNVLKIVGSYVLDFLLAPLKLVEAIFEKLTGYKIGGNYSIDGTMQEDPLYTPNDSTSGINMGNFIETKYSSNRRDNTSDYGGSDNQSMSYGGERTIILQLDGKEIYRTMEDYKRFENARGEA